MKINFGTGELGMSLLHLEKKKKVILYIFYFVQALHSTLNRIFFLVFKT